VGTSGLSPHLRFGEISPRQVWHAARFAAAEHPVLAIDIDKFLSELGWREFCRHLLFDAPDLAERNWQGTFDAFPWRQDKERLRPGSAAGPATRSSMPACASSGTAA
jgi:deoxyribodipyrimidine photo-lyase